MSSKTQLTRQLTLKPSGQMNRPKPKENVLPTSGTKNMSNRPLPQQMQIKNCFGSNAPVESHLWGSGCVVRDIGTEREAATLATHKPTTQKAAKRRQVNSTWAPKCCTAWWLSTDEASTRPMTDETLKSSCPEPKPNRNRREPSTELKLTMP